MNMGGNRMRVISKHYKFVAILLAAVILLSSIPLTIWGFGDKSTMDNASSEDKRIASEISNETGVSIEEVFLLKSNGRSWNEVLSVLKNKSNLGANSEKNNRDDLLLNSGLDEEFIAKLKKEGFSEENITEVKMLEERVAFQLQEIISGNQANQVTQEIQITQATQANKYNKSNQVNIEEPKVDISDSNKEINDISAYEELYKKIDIKNAVYFMLKLKEDFGSYEEVFDEYLYSLQADLDLNDYIKDKEAYTKSKDEKKLLLDEQKVITLEKIEEKSIEKIQKDNKNIENEVLAQQNDKTINTAASDSGAKDKNSLPDVPKPANEGIKPKNPTDEIMNEIKEINPIEN